MAFQIVKIPDLPVATSITSTDQYPIEQTDGTKRVTQATIDTYSGTKFLRKDVNESTTGTITSAGFTVSSSKKIKENIEPLDFNLVEKLLQLVPVSYTFKADSPIKAGQSDIGLIAEWVQPLFPELVSTDDKGNLSVDYAKLTVLLLLAIKKQYVGKE